MPAAPPPSTHRPHCHRLLGSRPAHFTYQGQLRSGGEPVTDTCEMAFRLYDDAVGGAQVGSAITTTVSINDGLFTVVLNDGGQFGGEAFTGDERWLGIRVRCAGAGEYADLGRQALTAAPYALYALGAPWSGLVGVPARSTPRWPARSGESARVPWGHRLAWRRRRAISEWLYSESART